MRIRIFPFIFKLLLLWTLGALFFGAIAGSRNFRQFHKLASQGATTTGTVTKLEPSNHRFVSYSYEAIGHRFSGIGNADYGNPTFEFLHVGDPVIVTYIRDNPEVSCLGSAQELLRNEELSIGGAAVTFPTFLLLICSVRYPSFRRWLAG
jgi:hypothetical protein